MNFQINQINSLYDLLGKDIAKNYFDDVIEKIKSEEGEEEEEEEERSKDDSDDGTDRD